VRVGRIRCIALLRLVTTLLAFAILPLQILVLPLAGLLYYPLQHWWGHKLVRWCGNMLMLAALWVWALSAWRIVHGQFWWQMIWGPLIALLVGFWLKSVHERTLVVQLGWDPGILDPFAMLPEREIRALFAARSAQRRRN
jgi:hypothetical protein